MTTERDVYYVWGSDQESEDDILAISLTEQAISRLQKGERADSILRFNNDKSLHIILMAGKTFKDCEEQVNSLFVMDNCVSDERQH